MNPKSWTDLGFIFLFFPEPDDHTAWFAVVPGVVGDGFEIDFSAFRGFCGVEGRIVFCGKHFMFSPAFSLPSNRSLQSAAIILRKMVQCWAVITGMSLASDQR